MSTHLFYRVGFMPTGMVVWRGGYRRGIWVQTLFRGRKTSGSWLWNPFNVPLTVINSASMPFPMAPGAVTWPARRRRHRR